MIFHSYRNFAASCAQLGGKLPELSNDRIRSGDEIKALNDKYYHLLRGAINAPDSQCLSIEKQEINIWVNTANITRKYKRNHYLIESERKSNDPLEGAKKACGLCDLTSLSQNQGQFLKLKGICDASLFNDFDLDFYVHGVKDNRPAFKGMAYSHMSYNGTDQHWLVNQLCNIETEKNFVCLVHCYK